MIQFNHKEASLAKALGFKDADELWGIKPDMLLKKAEDLTDKEKVQLIAMGLGDGTALIESFIVDVTQDMDYIRAKSKVVEYLFTVAGDRFYQVLQINLLNEVLRK